MRTSQYDLNGAFHHDYQRKKSLPRGSNKLSDNFLPVDYRKFSSASSSDPDNHSTRQIRYQL